MKRKDKQFILTIKPEKNGWKFEDKQEEKKWKKKLK